MFFLSPSSFKEAIAASAMRTGSRVVLALDLDVNDSPERLIPRAKEIVTGTREYVCAIKLNFHLILPLGLVELTSLINEILRHGLPVIADIKLNDISNTNRVATEYLWKAGFSAVIVNPFVGLEGGLDYTIERAKELGKGVLALAYMSHPGAKEGYGLSLRDGRTLFDLFIDRSREWKLDGVIVGSTRPDMISSASARLAGNLLIFSPGSGSQGADPLESLKAGSDYIIVGRSIIENKEPREEAKRLFDSLASWTESHEPRVV